MGLDTTHNAWHGPYSSFNEFRRWLANKIDINLDEYIGYGKDNAAKDLTTLNHKLVHLFNHSDCEGSLTPKQCKLIAEGIEEVLNNLSKEEIEHPENIWSHSNYNKAKQFRDGCLLAYSKKEKIKFH